MTTTEFINRDFFLSLSMSTGEKSRKNTSASVIAEDNKWGIVIHEVVWHNASATESRSSSVTSDPTEPIASDTKTILRMTSNFFNYIIICSNGKSKLLSNRVCGWSRRRNLIVRALTMHRMSSKGKMVCNLWGDRRSSNSETSMKY